MSLRDYKPKHKKAIWTEAFPGQIQTSVVKPIVDILRARLFKQKKFIHGPAVRAIVQSRLKPVRRVSKRRQQATAAYRRAAKRFVAEAVARGETCPVVAGVPELRDGRKYGHPVSGRLNEVHHVRGRLGPLLMAERFWIALSKQGHRWVHEHVNEARERGWLARRGDWNRTDDL